MAYIDENMETSNGSKKQIRVPSGKGGTDRTIYVNGSNSGYKLGQGNDSVYTQHGREVSSSLKDFVKNVLWEKKIKRCFYTSFFLLQIYHISYNKIIKHKTNTKCKKKLA